MAIIMIPQYSFHTVFLSFQEPSSLFSIAGASGMIRLTGTLDYEHAVFHQLEIVATVGYTLSTKYYFSAIFLTKVGFESYIKNTF